MDEIWTMVGTRTKGVFTRDKHWLKQGHLPKNELYLCQTLKKIKDSTGSQKPVNTPLAVKPDKKGIWSHFL